MINDFSNIPVDVKVTNNTGDNVTMDLRDILQTSVTIADGESIIVTVKTSEGLAILNARTTALDLETDLSESSETETKTVSTGEELINAITEAEAGETVKVSSDVTVTSNLVIDKDITIDTGTNTIDLGTNMIDVKEGTTTFTGSGKITSANSVKAIQAENDSTVIINGATVEATSRYAIALYDTSDIIVNSGTITSPESCITTNNLESEFSNITINGGTLTAEKCATIYVPSPCNIIVNGGTLNGGINARMGAITIKGGTINSLATSEDTIEQYYNFSGNVWLGDTIACMPGTYVSKSDSFTNELNINISGGTINALALNSSAVAIYNLGKVEQDITVTIKDTAVLTVANVEQPIYKAVPATEIVAESAKDYSTYTKYTNAITEDIADKYVA